MCVLDEQIHPELIELFDEVFEIDLPFASKQLDFTSEVISGRYSFKYAVSKTILSVDL